MVVSLVEQMDTATLCVTTVSVYAACDRTRGVEMLVSSSEVQAAKRTNGVSASQRMPRRAEVVGMLVKRRQVRHNGDVFCWREREIECKVNVRLLDKEKERSPLHWVFRYAELCRDRETLDVWGM
jgi:hypothetical protein